MPHSFDPQPGNTLDQPHRQLQPSRQNGHVLNIDAFSRRLEGTFGPDIACQADPRTTDADTHLQRELKVAFADLGGAAFALAHHGTATDPRLAPHVRHIHALYAQLGTITQAA
jgi:hypothetical protein